MWGQRLSLAPLFLAKVLSSCWSISGLRLSQLRYLCEKGINRFRAVF